MNRIYFDNAATTQIYPSVINAMAECMKNANGNPSSIYTEGQIAMKYIDMSRQMMASLLGCGADELYFTSGGSESDNWAVRGIAELMKKKGKTHIISSAIEHHAVLHTLNALKKQGFDITLLPVSSDGYVKPDDLVNAITDKTGLVSVIYANNEIGTIQPISELGAICKSKNIFFHTDAVQAVGHLPINIELENIDLLSLSAHKFHGPKGVGALFVKKGIPLPNIINGGAQERGKRAGTENTAGIYGMALALEESLAALDLKNEKIIEIRNYIINEALKIKKSRLNGGSDKRLLNNINFCFEGVEGESLILHLDLAGIAVSSGSACTSGSLDPSHVLLAIGLPHEIAHGSLRVSLSEFNTMEEAEYFIGKLPGIVSKLRDMSPVWERIIKSESV